MQKLYFLVSNLKQQTPLSIIVATIVANQAYSLWYQIPFVTETIFGSVSVIAPVLSPIAYTIYTLINTFVTVLGLAMVISKKGALSGCGVGLVVAVFFSINAYIASFVFAGTDITSSMPAILLNSIGLLLFYALPATILGYMRKE